MHYLIGQPLGTLLCNLISQHVIFPKQMLTSNPLFEFPLVHEVKVHGPFEIILCGFWLKILSETIITDVNHNFSLSFKG